jgi:hypothetical protein
VRPEHLATYVDLGLGLMKLGEEGRVELARFELDTPAHADLRQSRSRVLRKDCRFEILHAEALPAALPALARVSDAWLAEKATREKGFSNASFDVQYLAQFPLAVVRRGDGIIAFANLFPITVPMARDLGLPVSVEMPKIIYELMQFYPQGSAGRPSVLYVPVRRPPGPERRAPTDGPGDVGSPRPSPPPPARR